MTSEIIEQTTNKSDLEEEKRVDLADVKDGKRKKRMLEKRCE